MIAPVSAWNCSLRNEKRRPGEGAARGPRESRLEGTLDQAVASAAGGALRKCLPASIHTSTIMPSWKATATAEMAQ
jgi:hypothetical protein